jgi:quercetin dioxygenase-like cupin family protein
LSGCERFGRTTKTKDHRNIRPTCTGPTSRLSGAIIALAASAALMAALPIAAVADAKFTVSPLAEMRVAELPPDPLYWHVRSFPSLEEAKAAAGSETPSLTAEFDDRAWLFTLRSGTDTNAAEVVQIGPVPRVTADEYLLRINSAVAPPGTKTSVHSHPGSEAFYVLSGQVSQRTPSGTHVLDVGETMPGEPDVAMEVSSSGNEELRQLIMFVVDANRPFSTPSSLD